MQLTVSEDEVSEIWAEHRTNVLALCYENEAFHSVDMDHLKGLRGTTL